MPLYPSYPPPVLTGLPAAPVNGSYRILTNANGTFLQLYDPTDALWHSIFVQGSGDSATLAIGPGES